MKRALLPCLLAPAFAQEIAVRGPDPEVVVLGGKAIVTLTVDGARGDVALGPLPQVEGLLIAAGLPVSADVQVLAAGRLVTRPSTSWQITLEPRAAGVFAIPPLLVATSGDTATTRPLRLEAVRDATGDAWAFVELSTGRDTCWVHEPVRLVLRLGFDESFFQNSAIPLFRQQLDVPFQVQARWLAGLPGATLLAAATGSVPDAHPDAQRRSFALNDGRAEATRVADRTVGGRTFTVLELERRFLPDRSGELVFPAPLLRFAWASRFQDDLVNGRLPADRRDAVVSGQPLRLTVRPLPEAGRPPDFTGAVGRFQVTAEASPRDLAVGESLQLALHVTGDGELDSFSPPRFDQLAGFHVRGRIERRDGARATFTYELVPLRADLQAVPSIAVPFFDPGPDGGYRIAATAPLPITLRPLPAGAHLPRGDETRTAIPGENDLFDIEPVAALSRAAPGNLSPALLLAGLLSPWVLALALYSRRRRRERKRRDPLGVRARGALAAFSARAGKPGADLAAVFAEFLAARLRCSAAAVIGPDLGPRLQAAGVPAELAVAATRALTRLCAERYRDPGRAGAGQVDAKDADASEETAALPPLLEAAFARAAVTR